MDTNECQPLYIDIQEFYEGMNMKVEQQVPLLLVERQALNEAMEAEKIVSDILSIIVWYTQEYSCMAYSCAYLALKKDSRQGQTQQS